MLGVQAERERDGSYRGPAVWRGGDNPTSVSYDHRGIRDFKMNEGLTPLDVVQRAGVEAIGTPTTGFARSLACRCCLLSSSTPSSWLLAANEGVDLRLSIAMTGLLRRQVAEPVNRGDRDAVLVQV